MLLLLQLLFFVHVATAAFLPSLDWRDCTTQACYVLDACKSKAGATGKIVEVAHYKDVTMAKDCPFVMMIRPFSASVWFVQLRFKQTPRLHRKKITLTRHGLLLHECTGDDDGSIRVNCASDLTCDKHADSHHTRTYMHCLYTVTSRTPIPHTGPFSISYADKDGRETQHTLDSLGIPMKYVSCDGTKIATSTLQTSNSDVAVAAVDVSRTKLACPRGKAWKLMIEISGELKEARSGRCVKTMQNHPLPPLFSWTLDMVNDELYSAAEFRAVCVARPGCASCHAPLHNPCPNCLRVIHQPGNGTSCARLKCPDKWKPDKFVIDKKIHMGAEPVCGKKKDGEFGWSLKDAGKTVEFNAISCVQELSCHDRSPLRLECDDREDCEKPIAVEFEDIAEGMVCNDGTSMQFRATEAEEWATADDLACDSSKGRWMAEKGENRTVLKANTTIQCIAEDDDFLFYGTIAVTIGVVLLYATYLPYFFVTRKSHNEFDKAHKELTKQFARIKEYPKSPEKSDKSDKEKSKQSEVGKPIVDTRIYPDELTVKRKSKKKKAKTPGEPEFLLRTRPPEDVAHAFCKSYKDNYTDGWEEWIKKTGGIIQGYKPREEVLRLRAEKKAAKERRLAEEKKEKEEAAKAEEAAKKPSTPKQKSIAKSFGLATDKYLMQKKIDAEDRFMTIGPPPAALPAAPPPPAVEPAKKPRQYKKHSTASKDAEIKFEAPTTTHDASVMQVQQQPVMLSKEIFVTAEERPRSSECREPTITKKITKSRTRTSVDEDRVVEGATSASKMTTVGNSGLQSGKDGTDVAVEGTEDLMMKAKKRDKAKKKRKKSGGGKSTGGAEKTEQLPKTMTAVDVPDVPDIELQHSKQDPAAAAAAVSSTPVKKAPTSSGGSTTATGDEKRRRKKARCVESKGLTKGSGSLNKRNGKKKKKEASAQSHLAYNADGVTK